MASKLDEEKTQDFNPYGNLEAIFGPYVRFIEQTLTSETPKVEKPIFERSYTVRTLQEWDEKKADEYEYGNRIVAPESDLKSLLSKGAEPPLILQIFDPKTFKILTHCSVIEWTAPSEVIFIPMWMMKDFGLLNASKEQPKLRLRYYEKPFLNASFIQIQPWKIASIESDEFKDVQKLFELSLKKYQCLTIGDTLRIKHNENVHAFEITDVLSAQSIASVTPFNAVSLINTDVSIDFLPPKDAPVEETQNSVNREYGYDVDDADDEKKSVSAPNEKNENEKEEVKESENGNAKGGNKLDDNTVDKKEKVSAFANIEAQQLVCNENEKTIRIQLILIGNKKEALKINVSTTIKELYQHAKFVSGYNDAFELLDSSSRPPKSLIDPLQTVEEAQLNGARVTQKAL